MKSLSLRTGWSVATYSSLIYLLTCGCGSRTREVPLRGTFLVEGKLALTESLSQKVKSKAPNFSWVDKSGIRQPISPINFDSTTGQFSFEFKRDNLIRKVGTSIPELSALMGWARPLERLSSQGYDQNETGFIRIEAYSEISNGNSGEISYYLQKIAGIPMSASFSTTRSLIVDAEPIATQKVGVVKVNVKNLEGQSIQGALVSVIPLSVTGSKTYDLKPFDFRTLPQFSPVASMTNADGVAQAWPIPLGTDKTTKFQITVAHADYCTQFSSPAIHESSLPAIDVKLTPCTSAERTNQDVNWDVAFPSSLFVLSEARGALPVGTGLTNQEQVELQFTNKSSVARGLTVQIHEGETTESPVVMRQEVGTFANKLVIDLPPTFRDGTTASGRFLINLIARLSDEDKAAGRAAFSKQLTGSKGVYRLDPSKETDFQLIGHKSIQNLISGQDNKPFIVKYSKCSAGIKIAIAISPEGKKDPSVSYVPCDKNGNSFLFKNVYKGFSKNGGNHVIQFFHTDEFLNKSPDDSGSVTPVNRRNIEVDYGSPNANNAVLDSFTTIIGKNDPVPPVGPPATRVELTPSNLSDYAVAFIAPSGISKCDVVNPIPVPEIATPDSTSGQTVGQFYLGPVKSEAELLKSAVSCATGKIGLSGEHVTFPTNAAESASLLLTLIDTAGNYSSGSVPILPCAAATSGEKICWKN